MLIAYSARCVYSHLCRVSSAYCITWCAQASVFSGTTLAVKVKNSSDKSGAGAGAVVMAFNLT